MRLTEAERRLCKTVEAGIRFSSRSEIRANVIRRLLFCHAIAGKTHRLTPFGIRIVGARISGRLDLDNATPVGGGPLCPLEFHDCILDGGFSGAHARFSRLGFRKCGFCDAPLDAEGRPLPSLNLAGSSIGSDLDLREIKPDSDKDHLWIRAAGAWIDGEADLSRSVLKAPAGRSEQLLSEPSPDALDLSLAELRGDFQFLNGGRCSGRINMRGLHITGDIWMSGARLEVSKESCLFLQSATIGGNLVLDGRASRADGIGEIERLHAIGEINMVEIKLGGSLDINDVDLEPSPADPDRKSDAGVCVRLTGARIVGPVTIGSIRRMKSGSNRVEKSRIYGRLLLMRAELASRLTVKDVRLGALTEDKKARPTIDASSLIAKQVTVSGVEPLLWDEKRSREWAPAVRRLSVDLSGARVESLEILASRFSGYLRARPLTCARDVTLDLWVGVEVDLEGSDVAGSLDISGLRLDPDASRLSLRDAGIGRALKFKRPPGPDGRMLKGLVKARTTALKCLPETTLVETLWRYQSGPGKLLVCQAAFLRRGRLIRALDKPEALDDFVATHGHAVRSPGAAEEYALIRAAYAGQAEERIWIVSGPDGLLPFGVDPAPPPPAEAAEAVPGGLRAEAPAETEPGTAPGETAAGEGKAAASDDAVAAPDEAAAEAASDGKDDLVAAVDADAPSDSRAILKALPAATFKAEPHKEGDIYVVDGCFLRGDRLVRAEFRVTPAAGRVTVDSSFDEPVGPPVKDVPVARDLYTYPPEVEQGPDAKWVIPSVLNRDMGKELVNLTKFQSLLLPYVQPGLSIHGEVDLTDLSCDTLDDGGGGFWGKRLRFDLDRFVYRQATWAEDLPDVGFRGWVGRHVNRLIAERAWPSLITRRAWRERRLQGEDFWAPWQIRRNWIYQQFKVEPDLSSPTRHRIQQSEYRSQPFEQAIRVARQEGREDFAVQFEILKRRIEWSLFSRRSRWPLLLIGSLAAMAWIVATGGIHVATWIALAGLIALIMIATFPRSEEDRVFRWVVHPVLAAIVFFGTASWLTWEDWGVWERPRNFVVALLILAMLRYMSVASDWLMRNLFGYLRLPINAITSLVAAFLLGWAGVDLANDRQMLVIDVEPVASLVARDNEQRVYVGTPRGTAGARKVHCGDEIDEPLYALDVLIPLIDLRQEIRCEVGRAIPFDEAEPAQERKLLAYLIEWLLGPVLDSEAFWSAAKALYAIAGWFLVSLSILTFASANRPRGE